MAFHLFLHRRLAIVHHHHKYQFMFSHAQGQEMAFTMEYHFGRLQNPRVVSISTLFARLATLLRLSLAFSVLDRCFSVWISIPQKLPAFALLIQSMWILLLAALPFPGFCCVQLAE
jgi:hypothetical protein